MGMLMWITERYGCALDCFFVTMNCLFLQQMGRSAFDNAAEYCFYFTGEMMNSFIFIFEPNGMIFFFLHSNWVHSLVCFCGSLHFHCCDSGKAQMRRLISCNNNQIFFNNANGRFHQVNVESFKNGGFFKNNWLSSRAILLFNSRF